MDDDQGPSSEVSQTTEVKKVCRKSDTKRYSEILRDFDNFELSLISNAGEDLLADIDSPSVESAETTEHIQEPPNEDSQKEDEQEADQNTPAQEADLALCGCEDGVETALQYAKMWCRYAKDLLSWMEKRISLEQEFAKSIIKAAEGARSIVSQQVQFP
uniref:GMIP/FCHO2-like FCH domain-containing protein n=1 Tax=Knipowitschia caucasica TaxID=637954 RepID=A0AAV2KL74_KNICA